MHCSTAIRGNSRLTGNLHIINFCYVLHVYLLRIDSELSHRHLYEAVSLYWHLRGRKHLLFVPAIQASPYLGFYCDFLARCTMYSFPKVNAGFFDIIMLLLLFYLV